MRPLVAVLVMALVATAGCSAAGASTGHEPDRVRLVVFGAASLRGVLDELRAAYAAAHPEVAIELSTDASSTLATQILEGAPADVFLSADTANPRRIVDAGLADGDAVPIASNELVVITPRDDPGGVATTADLGRDGLRIVAAGPAVPITGYAATLLERLATLPGHPADLPARYERHVVSREDNVQAVVAKIALGEGDVGIVYRTDVLAADGIRMVEVPPEARVVAEYAGVTLAGSSEPDAARAFLAWVAGPDGQAILAGAGFRAAS